MDWLAPTYICPNPHCEEGNYILISSASDPLCHCCGAVLEEVEMTMLIDAGAPDVEEELSW